MSKRTRNLSKQSSMDELENLFKKQTRIKETRGKSFYPYTSEVAQKFAIENKIDPTNVRGTGAKGAITKKDIQDYLNNKQRELENATKMVVEISKKNALPEPDMRKLLRMVQKLSLKD